MSSSKTDCPRKIIVNIESKTLSPKAKQKARQAVSALKGLLRAALSDNGAPDANLENFHPDLSWHPGVAPLQLAENIMEQAAEFVSRDDIYQSGRVYCYSCSSSNCEHAHQPSAGTVFTGYSQIGKPCWEELFQYLLSLKDQRTNMLFGNSPKLLAHVVGRKYLIEEQLASWGKNSFTYKIIGQIVAGYFYVGEIRAAATVQLVETKGRKLHLQVITPDCVREALADSPDNQRSAFHRIHDALNEATKSTKALGDIWKKSRKKNIRRELHSKAFGLLRHTAHSIERKGRQEQRRTQHAEVRASQQRPVHKAFDDLTAASLPDFLLDRFRHSRIILGKNGRVHVFSEKGKHITSMILGRSDIDKRVARNRYAAMEKEEAESFRRLALSEHKTE